LVVDGGGGGGGLDDREVAVKLKRFFRMPQKQKRETFFLLSFLLPPLLLCVPPPPTPKMKERISTTWSTGFSLEQLSFSEDFRSGCCLGIDEAGRGPVLGSPLFSLLPLFSKKSGASWSPAALIYVYMSVYE